MTIKQLRKEITRKYGRKLNLSIVGACELTDLVSWGETTEQALFEMLDEAVTDEEPINR